jgi:hypothetical protein
LINPTRENHLYLWIQPEKKHLLVWSKPEKATFIGGPNPRKTFIGGANRRKLPLLVVPTVKPTFIGDTIKMDFPGWFHQ